MRRQGVHRAARRRLPPCAPAGGRNAHDDAQPCSPAILRVCDLLPGGGPTWQLEDVLEPGQIKAVLQGTCGAGTQAPGAPHDFFYSFNAAAGRPVAAALVSSKKRLPPTWRDAGDGRTKVVVERKGSLPVPVRLQKWRTPTARWETLRRAARLEGWRHGFAVKAFASPSARGQQVTQVPDVNPRDNVYVVGLGLHPDGLSSGKLRYNFCEIHAFLLCLLTSNPTGAEASPAAMRW